MEKKTLTKEERIAHNLKVLQGIAKFSKMTIDKMKAKTNETKRQEAKDAGVKQGVKYTKDDEIAQQ